MDFIKKRVDSFALKTFYPTKDYSIALSETSNYGITVKNAAYSSFSNFSIFNESNNLYYLINQLFYKNKSPYYYSSRDVDLGFDKLLCANSKLIFIPRNLFGEKVKPNSVQLSSSSDSILISDNGYGQLIDNSVTNVVSTQNLVGWWTFDEGYKYDTKGSYSVKNLRKTTQVAKIENATFTTGIQGLNSCISFDGYGYGKIEEYKDIDLEKTDDFCVSYWLRIPTNQQITSTTLNTVLSKGYAQNKRYFFKMDVYNQTDVGNTRKLKAYRSDSFGESSITSAALTAGVFNHIVFQKTGSTLQLYVNNSLAGSIVDSTNSSVYFKNDVDDLYLGAYVQTSSFDIIPEFSGSIDELRFYNGALTPTEISYLYDNPYNTNIVGNIYYSHGIIVLTNTSGSYNSIYSSASDTLKYKSIVKIREMKTELTKNPGDFNFSLNPSIFTSARNFDDKNLISSISSSFSSFSPYITTIGLMNKKGETVAIAKLKRPIKSNMDLPITFVIKIDI